MLELRNINKTYKMGSVSVHALKNISLTICDGEFVAIIGASGSGKSTLMHVLGLLDIPDSGEYILNGRIVSGLKDEDLAAVRNSSIGFVFQQFFLLPRMSALDNAWLPLIYAGKKHKYEKAKEKLIEVGLGDRIMHNPNELSGGQQQRVAIARALVNDPDIIMADEPTGNLDTKSKDEIISVLKNLNAQGKTVILVTHEKEIAEKAERIITLRDGEMISDTGSSKKNEHRCRVKHADQNGSSSSLKQGMEALDYIRQAISAIALHKMRSFLSVLGILIGVASVIAMLAMGTGAEESIKARLSSLGANLLTIRPGSAKVHGVAMESGSVTRFTFQDVVAISKLTDHLSAVAPSVTGRGQVVYGNKNWNTRIEGTSPEYEYLRSATPITGRFFTTGETTRREKVALLGLTVAKQLFGDENPVGATIKINLINFKVIGVLPSTGATSWHDQDDNIIIPVTTAMYRLLGKEYVDSIYAQAKAPELIDPAQDKIRETIRKRHRLTEKEAEDSFQIRNMSDIKEALESTTKTMSLLLGSIAAISLLVGGIGIMNIMLVSVTERTREIGLRKALGATKRDILAQFLCEAVIMTCIGGALGIVLGAGVSWTIVFFAKWALKISPFSVLLSVIFSFAVGVIFGMWPARRAAQLNPINALRYE